MKLVAAARLKKAQEKALDARAYSERMRDLMVSLSRATDLPYHPMLEERRKPEAATKYGFILVTSERGLAGSYSTNLIKTAADFLQSQKGEANLICIGRKGAQFFGKRGYNIMHQEHLPAAGARFEDAVRLAEHLESIYLSQQIDKVFVCYSKFYSPLKQVPQILQLLPIVAPRAEDTKKYPKEYLFEPDAQQLLEVLLPRYLLTLVFQTLLESSASEHGARMTAMTSATDNAMKIINQLTLKANRERQAAITKEILEVVSGAEALRG
jgi:F-type H+-transporting ATPase subunit gamma